ncbi:LysR family transcriptional regulator [Thiosulfatihalobacter marinus]|uniref:LysR family transcriptional regulator n=1 Tax=Thiosulfatihalobacter marinus TaxID=2792481 RepID=UPI001E5D31B4|nr:LysR family transcriptional regulator [Thiosulfatihalobacter marinus]
MGYMKGGSMRPNHHQFIAFAYVVREGSFSAAAARMGVTQSTITQHIGNLEKTVGTLLLRRGRDGVELTPTGQEFYDLADRMVSLDAEVSERLEGYNAMKNGRLNVIGNAPQPALRIIGTFRQRFPNIQVNFGLYDWSTATNMLRNRLADVGLITDAPVSDAWERIHIESAEYVVYCPNEHPLSAQASVSLKDLQEETVIIPERGSLTRKLLENACRTHAVALERTVTMATFPLMYEAVLQGIGVAVFLCNSSLIKKSVTEIPIREMPQKHETHLIATKDRVGLKLISEFINSVN